MKVFDLGEHYVVRFDPRDDKNYALSDMPKKLPNSKAKLAIAIAERWAMVAGRPGGEDSAGRAKSELMPVGQVVERSIQIADQLFDAFEKQGWMTPNITPEELHGTAEDGNGKPLNKL